jgi:hypothetical protein
MNYNDQILVEMKASAGLEDFINVFAVRLKLETPFIDAAEVYIRGFLLHTIWAASRGL